MDVVIGQSGTAIAQVVVVPGNGDGTFRSPIISALKNSNGTFPNLNCPMGIGDLNGDGAVDLVIPDASSAGLYIALGNNNGTFSLGSFITFYFTGQTRAYVLDLNGDAHLDIVVLDTIGATTYVLLGNGDGTFKAAVTYLAFATLLADADGDGHPDLIADVYPGQIETWKGNPNGTFAAASIDANVPTADFLLGTGDFNSDGIADLTFLTPTGVGVLLGKGNLTYGTVLNSLSGGMAALSGALTLADFNADGHPDIAMGVDGGIAVLIGEGDGTFAGADLYDLGHLVGAVSIADFNGDRLADIAVAMPASFPRLLLGSGTGSFVLGADQNQSYGSQAPSNILQTEDFNADGKRDLNTLISTNQYPYGQTFVLLGGSSGQFAAPLALAAGPGVVADFNKDGRDDLATITTTITTFLGKTDGTFQQVTTPLQYATGGIAAVGDLNHDGKLDLLTFEYPILRLWLGKGDGTFASSNLVGDSQQSFFDAGETVAIADLDSDGNADIVVTPYPNPGAPLTPLVILYGNGDGTFQGYSYLPVSHRYGQLVIADVNQDNKPDLVLSDSSGIAVIANLGARSFDHEEHYVAGQSIAGLGVADVNGDGFPDIVASNGGGTTVAVLLNLPNGSQGAPSDGDFNISPEPSNYGQTIALTMTMSAPPGSGKGTPTGSVTFNVDGAFLTTVNLVQGKATYSYSSSLVPGSHTFVGTYNGDGTYRLESFALLHTVLPPTYSTHTSIAATPTNVYASQTVRFTATITSTPPPPSGWITFLDGGLTLGGQLIDTHGVAVLDTALLAAGTHHVTATYQGYQDNVGVNAIYLASTSTPVTVAVNVVGTATALSASNTTPTAGTVVTFMADVTSGAGVPFGGASFYDGSLPLGTGSLQSNGTVTFSTAALSVGKHNITAAFNSNATFGQSVSPILVVDVVAAPGSQARTVISLKSGTNPTDGSPSLIAKVRSLKGPAPGRVAFLDNGALLGSSEADGSGTAVFSVASFGTGAHQIYASYAGNPDLAPAVSPAFPEQWPATGPGFMLTPESDYMQVSGDSSPSLAITIVPTDDFHGSVALSCSEGLPAGYSCSFSPAVVNGGGVVHLAIQPTVQKTESARLSSVTMLGLLLVSFVGVVAKRRQIAYTTILIFMGAFLMTGCGNFSSSSQSDLLVLSVRAQAETDAGIIIHSTQIELNVVHSR